MKKQRFLFVSLIVFSIAMMTGCTSTQQQTQSTQPQQGQPESCASRAVAAVKQTMPNSTPYQRALATQDVIQTYCGG